MESKDFKVGDRIEFEQAHKSEHPRLYFREGSYKYWRPSGEWAKGYIRYVDKNSILFITDSQNGEYYELPTKGHPQYDEKFASAEGHLRHVGGKTNKGDRMFNKLSETVKNGIVNGTKQSATNEVSSVLVDLGKKLLGDHPFLDTPQGKELSKIVVALLVAEVAPKTGLDIDLHPLAELQVQTGVMNLLEKHMGAITEAIKKLAKLQG